MFDFDFAIKTGLPRAFRNGMTIGITPKNEVLRVKSLKQPILQEIKESSKFGNYGPPLVVFLVSGGLSEGARPFPLKILDTKISVNSTSGECINAFIPRIRHFT